MVRYDKFLPTECGTARNHRRSVSSLQVKERTHSPGDSHYAEQRSTTRERERWRGRENLSVRCSSGQRTFGAHITTCCTGNDDKTRPTNEETTTASERPKTPPHEQRRRRRRCRVV